MKDNSEIDKSFTEDSKHLGTTAVYREEKHGTGIWGNPRVPMTVRVDSGLKKAFTDYTQRVFSSTCLPLECIMASMITANVELEKASVYPSRTYLFDFKNIQIQRQQLRTRRKLVVDEPTTDVSMCFVENCNLPGTVEGEWVETNSRFMACPGHVRSIWLKDKRWKVF